ncbi:MAG: aldolase/citrate lyase family protein [Rhodoferax sp.]|uniref:HpcH/HpaI aldolase/citrate lyase family protein n=2 Tax=Rhodoferax sp. TaxID=50421 RepID=UPI003C7825D8
MSARSVLALARSFLFVPANRPDRFVKALASGADAVIIDLEDAVAADNKAAARDQLADAFGRFAGPERGRLLVRINARGTPWFEDDLKLLRLFGQQGLAGVMVPKAETDADLQGVAEAAGPDCGLLPQVESVLGLDGIDALALGPRVQRLAFGNLDFQADAGLACDADEAELMPVRLALLLASRRAALPAPVDGVTPGTQDGAQLQADVVRSRRGGFGGKLCIHPAQVAVVNAAFAPAAAELAWAQRVMAAYAAAGGGVFSLDGRMVDAPVLRLAQHTLALSRAPEPGAQP